MNLPAFQLGGGGGGNLQSWKPGHLPKSGQLSFHMGWGWGPRNLETWTTSKTETTPKFCAWESRTTSKTWTTSKFCMRAGLPGKSETRQICRLKPKIISAQPADKEVERHPKAPQRRAFHFFSCFFGASVNKTFLARTLLNKFLLQMSAVSVPRRNKKWCMNLKKRQDESCLVWNHNTSPWPEPRSPFADRCTLVHMASTSISTIFPLVLGFHFHHRRVLKPNKGPSIWIFVTRPHICVSTKRQASPTWTARTKFVCFGPVDGAPLNPSENLVKFPGHAWNLKILHCILESLLDHHILHLLLTDIVDWLYKLFGIATKGWFWNTKTGNASLNMFTSWDRMNFGFLVSHSNRPSAEVHQGDNLWCGQWPLWNHSCSVLAVALLPKLFARTLQIYEDRHEQRWNPFHLETSECHKWLFWQLWKQAKISSFCKWISHLDTSPWTILWMTQDFHHQICPLLQMFATFFFTSLTAIFHTPCSGKAKTAGKRNQNTVEIIFTKLLCAHT